MILITIDFGTVSASPMHLKENNASQMHLVRFIIAFCMMRRAVMAGLSVVRFIERPGFNSRSVIFIYEFLTTCNYNFFAVLTSLDTKF